MAVDVGFWLATQGYHALDLEGMRRIVVPIHDLFPVGKGSIIPDIIGLKDHLKVAIVECETKIDKGNVFAVVGKLAFWNAFASKVYLAVPKQILFNSALLEKLKVGILLLTQTAGLRKSCLPWIGERYTSWTQKKKWPCTSRPRLTWSQLVCVASSDPFTRTALCSCSRLGEL